MGNLCGSKPVNTITPTITAVDAKSAEAAALAKAKDGGAADVDARTLGAASETDTASTTRTATPDKLGGDDDEDDNLNNTSVSTIAAGSPQQHESPLPASNKTANNSWGTPNDNVTRNGNTMRTPTAADNVTSLGGANPWERPSLASLSSGTAAAVDTSSSSSTAAASTDGVSAAPKPRHRLAPMPLKKGGGKQAFNTNRLPALKSSSLTPLRPVKLGHKAALKSPVKSKQLREQIAADRQRRRREAKQKGKADNDVEVQVFYKPPPASFAARLEQ